MRRVAPVIVLWVGFVIGGSGCHTLYPFEAEPADDSSADLSQLDAGLKLDSGGGAEGSVVDAPADLPDVGTTDLILPDQLWPDTLPPDHGPYWDQGGGTTCKNLLVSPAKPIQVSRTVSTHSGAAPSITAVGDTFYVAFTENKEVLVREINATSSLAAASTFSAKLNVTGTAAAPWITYNKVGQKLAVVWHEKTTTGTCSSNIYFKELSPTAGGYTLAPSCHLNSGHTTVGYGPASLVHDGTSYLLVSPAELSGSACGTHAKYKFHQFNSCTAFTGKGYDGVSDQTNTFLPVVTATGSSANPYLSIRLQQSGATINIRSEVWNSSLGYGTFSAISAQQGSMDRPSLVMSGSGTWFAWTDTSNQIKLFHYNTGSTSKPPAPMAGYAKNPFLAYKPQVGSTGVNAKAVLAFTQTNSSGSTATAVKLAVLNSATQSAGTTRTVAAAATTSYSGVWSPADTVVAAGTNGFGVAWTEQVSSTQREVFFQWVGCQP
jgi:hypothetical protein